jgi:hypothetical protein
MPRALLLSLALLAAVTASAAVPIAPLEPRIGPLGNAQSDPAAATNGTTTLVAWTNENSPYAETYNVYARLLGVHASAVDVGPGLLPQVAWNGETYLIANSIGASRFNRYPYANVAATVVRADGTIGTRRTIHTSLGAGVTAVAWTGAEWAVGIVSEGAGRVLLLDRELHVVRTIELGAARSAGLTTIDGAVWVVHQRTDDTEVFAIGDEETRFRVAGRARMVGRVAIVEDLLRVSIFDPLTGFPEPRPILATSDVPLQLVHLAPFGSGAILVVYSIVGKTMLLVTVDADGFRQEYTAALTGYTTLPAAAVAGSTLFVLAVSEAQSFQIFGFPLQPWPRTAFTRSNDAIVSIGDFSLQHDAIVASNGTNAVAFWNQTIGDASTEAAFTRAIDANGVPYGLVTQLPFSIGPDADAVLDVERFVLVWTSPYGDVYASAGGAPLLLGQGSHPAVAHGAHGTFAVWRDRTGTVRGTPLRDDASPHVPGGFPILPSLTALQGAPAIAAVPQGYNVVWSAEDVTSVILSPAGTPLTSSAMADATTGRPVMGGTLAAWPRMLAAFGGSGTFPFERSVPQWGDDWTPVAIDAMAGGRHLVTIARGGALYTSVVTVVDGQIVSETPLRLLLDSVVDVNSVTVVDETPIVVFNHGRRVLVATYPVKRRAAR